MAIKDAERRKAAAIERDKAIDMQRVAILESPPPMGAGFGAIVRSLDANGMHVPVRVEQVRQPDGRMGLVPIFGRHQFMDGEQLVEEVAQRVVQLIFQGAQAQMDAAGMPASDEPVVEDEVQMFTGEELVSLTYEESRDYAAAHNIRVGDDPFDEEPAPPEMEEAGASLWVPGA